MLCNLQGPGPSGPRRKTCRERISALSDRPVNGRLIDRPRDALLIRDKNWPAADAARVAASRGRGSHDVAIAPMIAA
jgi:hypothetical protein